MAQINTYTGAYVSGMKVGQLVVAHDTATGDVDKTITVPANRLWRIVLVWLLLDTSGNAGFRHIRLTVHLPGGAIFGQSWYDASTTLNTVDQYLWADQIEESAMIETDSLLSHYWSPLPCLWMPAGFYFRLWENDAVDPANDVMPVAVTAIEYAPNP